MRILIAEDDITSRRVLETALNKWGYTVESTCDGNEAWEKLQDTDAPRLLILDWMMPGMEGIDVCEKLRTKSLANESYTYVILLTAKDEKAEIVMGIEAGADDYVVKPFDPEELRVRVRAGERIIDLQSKLLAAKEALAVQASHDPLTGIFNRRAIFRVLNTELSRVRRDNKALSIVMCDIDHFKNVNDTFGHQIGDEVLCRFVERIHAVVRDYDHVGRYGGEEFLIIVPGVCGTPSESLFERIRRSVAETEMHTTSGNIPITASFGVASSDGTDNIDDLIRAADSALYHAKASGRNRFEYNNNWV